MKKDRVLTLINGFFPVSGIGGFDSIAFAIRPAQSLKGIFLMIDLKIIGIFFMMGLHVMVLLLFTHNAIHNSNNKRCVEDHLETFIQVYEERFERPYGFFHD